MSSPEPSRMTSAKPMAMMRTGGCRLRNAIMLCLSDFLSDYFRTGMYYARGIPKAVRGLYCCNQRFLNFSSFSPCSRT